MLIDGASQTRSENGSSFDEEAPSVEALEEFKITTALAPAEYGRTTGGIENFVTKSGTNTFHGTAYEIFRNEDLDRWRRQGDLMAAAVVVSRLEAVKGFEFDTVVLCDLSAGVVPRPGPSGNRSGCCGGRALSRRRPPRTC